MKTYLSSIKTTLLALLLSVGVGIVFASSAFTVPSGVPSATKNADVNIHEGGTDQIKTGALSLESLIVNGKSVFLGNVEVDEGGVASNGLKLESQKSLIPSTFIELCTDSTGKVLQCPPVINGMCNQTLSGTVVTVKPTNNLCTSGTSAGASGSNPYSWWCDGTNGGTDAWCSTLPIGHGSIAYTTPGAHSFTVPVGITQVTVQVWGAGGSGGNGGGKVTFDQSGYGGAGGGSGAYSEKVITVSSGATIAVQVGAGGANVQAGGTSSSTLGSIVLSATGGNPGGSGGSYENALNTTPVGGSAGTASGGTINQSGCSGGAGFFHNASFLGGDSSSGGGGGGGPTGCSVGGDGSLQQGGGGGTTGGGAGGYDTNPGPQQTGMQIAGVGNTSAGGGGGQGVECPGTYGSCSAAQNGAAGGNGKVVITY
jgi:hypothetical protein